jgi:hypothetical protein
LASLLPEAAEVAQTQPGQLLMADQEDQAAAVAPTAELVVQVILHLQVHHRVTMVALAVEWVAEVVAVHRREVRLVAVQLVALAQQVQLQVRQLFTLEVVRGVIKLQLLLAALAVAVVPQLALVLA